MRVTRLTVRDMRRFDQVELAPAAGLNLLVGANGAGKTTVLEALGALRDEQVVIAMRDSNSSALVREASSNRCRHVVMPLRL